MSTLKTQLEIESLFKVLTLKEFNEKIEIIIREFLFDRKDIKGFLKKLDIYNEKNLSNVKSWLEGNSIFSEYDALRILREEEDTIEDDYLIDNTLEGCKLISRFTKNVILGAKKDMIISITIEDAIIKGMKELEFKRLSQLNWMEENGSLVCFV